MRTSARVTRAVDDGFTLIELLVVMVIIGLLAAIAIPSFLAQRNKAFDAQATSDVRAAQNEVEAYFSGPQTLPDAVVWSDGSAVPATTVTVKRSKDVPAGAASLVYLHVADAYCVSVQSRSGSWVAISSSRSGATKQPAACSTAQG